MEKVREFIDSLLEQKGITDLDEEARERVIGNMTESLLDKIDEAAINALPEDKAVELASGLENGSIKREDVANYMKDAGLDLEKISFDTMMIFRDLYLGDMLVPGDDEEGF